MRFFKSPAVVVLPCLVLVAFLLRVFFFGISTNRVPESSDESLSILQAKMIVAEGRTPLLVMANPYQFPVESYLHAPFVKLLPRNALGARVIPFILSIAATAFFIAVLFLIAPLRTSWPALILLLFPSAYILMLGSAYFIPQHSSFALLGALALYLSFRMRNARAAGITALAAGFCTGLAFSNHMLALPLVVVLCAYALLGPKLAVQARVIPAFAIGILIGLIPYLLAVWLLPGSYGSVAGIVSPGEALHRLWGLALNNVLAGVMGIKTCFFPDNRHMLTLIPGFGGVFALIWLALLLIASLLRLARFIMRWLEYRFPTLEANDVLTGIAWIGFLTFLFSARSLSHTYRYLLPVAWIFPFTVGYVYARSPKIGRVLVGGFAVFLAGYNLVASAALMREWARPGFAEKEANLVNLKPAIGYLEQLGIHHAYASYWMAYRLTYETDGRVICSQPMNERFPGWPIPFKKEVESGAKVAYLMAPNMSFKPQNFENDLAAMGVSYHKESLGPVDVYTDFTCGKATPLFPLPGSQMRVSVSGDPSGAAHDLLADGNPHTFWQATNAFQKGLWIQVDFAKPEIISRVTINHTGLPDKFTGLRGITVQTENGWTNAITQDIGKARARFEYRNDHPVYNEGILTYNFPPFKTGALRLMLNGPAKNRKLVMGDIKVYRTEP
jgi:hypothetical protein